MRKKSCFAQMLIFLVFIGLFFALNLLLPDKEFSQRENRSLQQLPKLSATSLFDGSFTKKYDSYAADQFAFRDVWVTTKAKTELATGKTENNDVYYCGDDTLIKRFDAPDAKTLDAKLKSLNSFTESVNSQVYFALIPGASDIWKDKLPSNAPSDSQKEVIDYCYSDAKADCIDIYSALSQHSDEYIYYRTDHHWTSLGAYYGYKALMGEMALPSKELTSYNSKAVSDSFYGTNYSSSGFTWIKPDEIDTFVEDSDVKVESYTKGLTAQPVIGGLYYSDYLSKKDKYSMFLGGVTPMVHISTGNSDAPSILIIRDSYTDSVAPFLTDNFSDIYIVDLRYYKNSITEYANSLNVDKILVMYSVSNFCSDNSIALLGA